MKDRDLTLSDFNTYVRDFGSRVFLVAGRVFDLAPGNFEFLACAWYEKNGLLELPGDRYVGKLPNGQEAVRYFSVDALILNQPTELVGIGKHIYEGWVAEKARLNKTRNADPVVVITKPNPEPPKPEPEPIVPPPVVQPKPKPKKPRPEWMIKASVYLTLLTPVSLVVLYFTPPPWNMLAKAIFETLKLIFGG